jgi:hypothetical protein
VSVLVTNSGLKFCNPKNGTFSYDEICHILGVNSLKTAYIGYLIAIYSDEDIEGEHNTLNAFIENKKSKTAYIITSYNQLSNEFGLDYNYNDSNTSHNVLDLGCVVGLQNYIDEYVRHQENLRKNKIVMMHNPHDVIPDRLHPDQLKVLEMSYLHILSTKLQDNIIYENEYMQIKIDPEYIDLFLDNFTNIFINNEEYEKCVEIDKIKNNLKILI